ncbi:MAG: serine/threonine protein kinase, partial [Myxococcota bacterium]
MFPESERFEQIRLLGSGAFGDVYKVYDREWGRVLALKKLRLMQPRPLLRFKSEFRSIRDIRHKNLVQLHELFGGEGAWYFTMEFVDGLDLTAWLGVGDNAETIDTMEYPDIVSWEEGPPVFSGSGSQLNAPSPRPTSSPDVIRDVFSQVAQGLRALHATSMIHRDLKPQNVLVDQEGQVKLLDFGLTELLATPHNSIDVRGVAGTPGYIAPEMLRGEAITEAADWYSFGVMLHQALWGTLPTQESSSELQEESAYAPLASLCRALCSLLPEQRPSGEAVLAALQGTPSVARPHPSVRALVGRHEQLAFLEERFQEARDDGPAVVFLMGESGVGKTALAYRFLKDAHTRHRALVLSARCYEEMSVPLRALDAIVDALAQRLGRMAEPRLRSLLPRFIAELAQLFPVLGWLVDLVEQPRRSLPPDPQEVRFRAFGALRDLLGRLADSRPMIVFLDDLQWGDAASASVLVDLLLAHGAPQLLFLGTCRSEEAHDAAFVKVFQAFADRSWMHQLTVPPLSAEESQRMAQLL